MEMLVGEQKQDGVALLLDPADARFSLICIPDLFRLGWVVA
jgi:hypothetical protein